MRIACLQFAPQVGDIENNLNRADALLSRANPRDIDLLVLPELAFSGYNFKSLKEISPFLEPTAAGISSLWARTTALKYECVVTVGYPEKVDVSAKWPASPEYYNSAITVNADGDTVANYRKSFLYYCDETWALEGPDGFFGGVIPGLGNVAIGICMDLNPYKFEAPWNAWEFANHILHRQANLVVLAMAWLTRQNASMYSRKPKEPDMETLSYWIARIEPVIRAEDRGEIIVVIANRCGVEGEAVYAGTSCVLGVESGEVKLYGILGRGEKDLLVVDTSEMPQAKLVAEQTSNFEKMAQRPPQPLQKRGHLRRGLEFHATNEDELLASIDGVLGISPVEPRSPHSYYSIEPPRADQYIARLKSSGFLTDAQGSSASMSPPASASFPKFERPPSTKSRNSSHSRQPEPPVISERRKQDLEIISVDGYQSDEDENSAPDSASSMTVNTPWETGASFFRAEDISRIIKSQSPAPRGTGSDLSSSVSSLHRPQSPVSRTTSRNRHPRQESVHMSRVATPSGTPGSPSPRHTRDTDAGRFESKQQDRRKVAPRTTSRDTHRSHTRHLTNDSPAISDWLATSANHDQIVRGISTPDGTPDSRSRRSTRGLSTDTDQPTSTSRHRTVPVMLVAKNETVLTSPSPQPKRDPSTDSIQPGLSGADDQPVPTIAISPEVASEVPREVNTVPSSIPAIDPPSNPTMLGLQPKDDQNTLKRPKSLGW